jgi:hypothetical protein
MEAAGAKAKVEVTIQKSSKKRRSSLIVIPDLIRDLVGCGRWIGVTESPRIVQDPGLRRDDGCHQDDGIFQFFLFLLSLLASFAGDCLAGCDA